MPNKQQIETALLFITDLTGQGRLNKSEPGLVHVIPPKALLPEADKALGFNGDLLAWNEEHGIALRTEQFSSGDKWKAFLKQQFPGRDLLFWHGRTEATGYNLVVVISSAGMEGLPTKRVLIASDHATALLIGERNDLSEDDINALFKAGHFKPPMKVTTCVSPWSFNKHDYKQLAISIACMGNIEFDLEMLEVKLVPVPNQAERRRAEEEKRRVEEQRRRAEEEKRRQEEGARTGIATLSHTLPSVEELLRDGLERAREEDYENAVETFASILRRHPDHVEANFYTGGCHYRLGNAKMARRFWEKVLELEPGHQKALQYLRRIDGGL
ncbi:MAG: hypothetical protein GHCLOJNM_02097 [bacterium]|nr:hypothetical protein [bacterium]